MILLILAVTGMSGCINSETADNKQTEMKVVASNTMEPTLYRGDIVIVEKKPNNIQVGDIVIYNADWYPNPIIHRIIAINNDSEGNPRYELKGDNLNVSDPELASPSQISYRVLNTENGPNVIPKLGYIVLWISGS